MALLMVVLAGCASDPGGAKDEADTAPDDTGAADTHTGCCDTGDSADSAGDTDTAVDTDTGGDTDTGVTDTGPMAPYDLAGASYIYEGATAWQVLRSGDLDGDGWDDLLLGDPMLYPGTSCSPGRAVLVRGPLTEGVLDVSEDGETVWSFWGTETGPLDETTGICEVGDEAGMGLERADLDGDGVSDLVVGAIHAGAGGAGAGAVYVLPGPLAAGGSLVDAPIQVYGADGEAAGGDLAIGDVTGDGANDILIGVSGAPSGEPRPPEVWVLDGPMVPGTHAADEGVRWEGSAVGDYPKVAIGDLDGDGIGDAVVGAYAAERVYVLRGPLVGGGALEDATDVAMGGGSWGVELGAAVAAGVDLDGDGYGDWISGARGNGGGGAAWIVSGATRGRFSIDEALAVLGSDLYRQVGVSVALPGDVDADGWADVLLGASDRAFLAHGPPSGTVELGVDTPSFLHWEERAGGAVAGAGDVDGDGADDLLIGGTFYGAWIVLASEL